MKLAVLPRYLVLNKENHVFNVKHYINHEYILLAQQMGVGLCAVMSPNECEDYASFFDGLIIPGSNNKVNPSYYGEKPLAVPQDYDVFALDVKVIDAFVKANKPILGICAGHQALNIYFGGTIDYLKNDGTKPHWDTRHFINVKPDSFVYDAFGSERVEINSYHVMSIKKLGRELDVAAESDDGVIEAIENKERRIFGVQWHPEASFKQGETLEKRIFENFIRSISEKP